MEKTFQYGIDFLTAGKAIEISKGLTRGILTKDIRQKINQSSSIVEHIAAGEKAVYGINTGFGPLCTTMISKEDTIRLQENILKSHAVGIGVSVEDDIARLMLVLKIQALAQGYSGIQESTLERMI